MVLLKGSVFLISAFSFHRVFGIKVVKINLAQFAGNTANPAPLQANQ
jgi:hypothetical protein